MVIIVRRLLHLENLILRCLTTLRSKFRTAFEFLPVTPLKTREVTEKDGVLRNTANRATFFTI